MAIKEIRREWSPCQLDYVKEFLLHSEADVKDLPVCCVGSKARVGETGNVYTCSASGEWTTQDAEGVDGCESAAHKMYVTDGTGKPHWEEKLAYKDVKVEVVMPDTSVSNVWNNAVSVTCEHNGKVKVGDTGEFILDGVPHAYVAVEDTSPGPRGIVRLEVEGVTGYIKLAGTSNMYLYQAQLPPQGSTHTISLTHNVVEIKTIDPELLPEDGAIYYDGFATTTERQAYADGGLTKALTFKQGAEIAKKPFALTYMSGTVPVITNPFRVTINDSQVKIFCDLSDINSDGTLSRKEIALTFTDTPT